MYKWLILVCVPCSFALGCKDDVKCSEEIQQARRALSPDKTNLELARQWREKASQTCGKDVRINALQGEIDLRGKALALEAERAEEEQAKRDGDAALEAAEKSWNDLGVLTDISTEKKDSEGLAEAQLEKTRQQTAKLEKGLNREQAARVSAFNKKQYELYSNKIAK